VVGRGHLMLGWPRIVQSGERICSAGEHWMSVIVKGDISSQEEISSRVVVA
jgi:hypothetical protein